MRWKLDFEGEDVALLSATLTRDERTKLGAYLSRSGGNCQAQGPLVLNERDIDNSIS